MKKLLVLGAMQMHVPLLKRAKERGIYVLTCDYYKHVEGHKYADEPHYDSTTDLEAVLKLSRESQIDAIMTFNSDPAALTAAYVSEKLGLPGNSYKSVKILSEKDLFRKFLKENGFNVPFFKSFDDKKSLLSEIQDFSFPVLIKPVDSSGSKGVTVVDRSEDIADAYDLAVEKSRCKRVVVEEYIEPLGPQIHGDAFIADGKVVFSCLGDHHFDKSINNLVPYSTTFPSQHTEEEIHLINQELQEIIAKVDFRQGGINVEARISKKDGKIYFIEVGARNGGNFTPIVIQYATGFNFIDAALDAAMGIKYSPQTIHPPEFFSYLVPHVKDSGVFQSIELSGKLQNHTIEQHIYKEKGETVESFKGANAAVGVLIAKYDSMDQMQNLVDDFENNYKVHIA